MEDDTAHSTVSVLDAAVSRLTAQPLSATALDLSVGEPDWPTPPAIVASGVAALQGGATKYTPRAGYASLRSAIADKLAAANGYIAAVEDIVVTGGGTPAVAIAIGAACRPGDGILLPDPGWPNYEIFATRLGLRVRRYRQDPRAGCTFDLDEIGALVEEHTRMIVINSPSNPTGGIADEALVRGLVELAERHDLMICSDEAYEAIGFDAAPVSPAAVGGRDRTFACYTFSKTYAMTGWRVGYVVTPPQCRDAAMQMQIAISGCAAAMAQKAAETALTQPPAEVAAAIASYRRRRDLACEAAERHGLRHTRPAGGFYLWLDTGDTGLSGQQLADLLRREQDVVVSAGEVYSTLSPGHVRVSYVAAEETLLEGMRRIGATVEGLRSTG